MEQHTPVAVDPSSSPQTQTQDPSGPRPSSFPFLGPAQAPDEVGRLGGFRLLRLLGQGGMGMVFEADDPGLARRVAVKLMKPEAARDEVGRKRFLREARAAAAVGHDHVVPVHQVGEDGGVPFLVMPLLRGESLEGRLQRRRRLPAAEVARIGREAALGLAAAHAAGLIHRDVKPSNLWLEEMDGGAPGGRVRVLDFGLARPEEDDERLTGTNALLGTASYMAPEQARGEPVDARADLFSLGCVLYRMATGKPPFTGASLTAVLTQIATHNPPPPHAVESSTPPALSDLVMRLLSKDPAGRPTSAREVADALRRIEPPSPAGESTVSAADAPAAAASPETPTTTEAAGPTGTVVQPIPPLRGRPWRWIIPAALAACALLALSAFLLPPVRAWLFPPAGRPSGPPVPTTDAAAAAAGPFKGFIDVVIYDPSDPHRQNVHLNDPDVMPLRPGDKIAVEAGLDRSAYCYVLWIDADGTVDPVYPWRPGHWDTRPAEEQPVQWLRRPEALDRFFPIKESAAGMETLVLLVREKPLPPDVDLRAELGPVQPQGLQTLRATAWFENGGVVKNEAGRAPNWDEERIDDPLRATQEQIRSRLGRWFAYTRAVSFADRGK